MRRYVSLLRGINVSGKNMIKMEPLRKSFEKLQFENVSSYLQSGNIIFSSKETNCKELETQIAQQIQSEYGLSVPVLVLSIEKLKSIIDNNPFVLDKSKAEAFFHTTILLSPIPEINIAPIALKKQENEAIEVVDDVIYLYCPDGYGRTKLTNNLIESKLKVGATTRNWKTIQEIYKIGIEN